MRARQGSGRWLLPVAFGLFVVAFALVMGAVFYWGSTTTGADGRFGSVPIPGRATVHLPSGRVDVTFTEDLSNQTIHIPRFGILVADTRTGQQVHVRFSYGSLASVNGVSHVRVGSLDVPHAGDYRIDVTGDDAGLGQQLRFGTSRQHGWVLRAALPAAGACVIGGLLLIWAKVRRGRRERGDDQGGGIDETANDQMWIGPTGDDRTGDDQAWTGQTI